MNRNDFTRELKELMSSMSEEEIEKTISALNDCKSAISKKNDREKGGKARLYSTTQRHEAVLYYEAKGGKKGTLQAVGASLLTLQDYDKLNYMIPGVNDSWWLYERYRVTFAARDYVENKTATAHIRPVLIIDAITGELAAKDFFYINDERFKLLTSSLAIKTSCLEDECTYRAANYESSAQQYCVDGWYQQLIRENGQRNT